ncbi:MAG: bifunctional methylenetetrahydrofolate dehydrogenase/methenyltetrahydrofolate cyclohydrolase FolD [Clostridia bacterium]|nr:bifunctional methylenetetrahydrofolate dehydrogenase/methenyltetrahydrofolate cyclohydrolase FolD [Clostridia bacterium]
MAIIIDGRATAAIIKDEVKSGVTDFVKKYNRSPALAVILVGEDPSSKIYVGNKIKACEYCGIESFSYKLEETATEAEILELINQLNNNNAVDGILLQLPVPRHLDEYRLISAISPYKDVDGISVYNLGGLLSGGKNVLSACTPTGCIDLIKRTGVDIKGKHAVVVGRSNIVGKPVAIMLLNENATVTMCHSRTVDLANITRQADILVVSIGKTNFITADMIKPGAIVIDVGINRTENGLKGDVDFEAAKEVAGFITPVPGGVGLMTVAMLMKNTLLAAKLKDNNG